MNYLKKKSQEKYALFRFTDGQGNSTKKRLYYGPVYRVNLPNKKASCMKLCVLFLYLITCILQIIASMQNIQVNKVPSSLVFTAVAFMSNLFLLAGIVRFFICGDDISQDDYDSINLSFRFSTNILTCFQLLYFVNIIRFLFVTGVFDYHTFLCCCTTLVSVFTPWIIRRIFCRIPFYRIDELDLEKIGLQRYNTTYSSYQIFLTENGYRLDHGGFENERDL